ncbi:MAG: PTH1 family peptidyl-tRNA hydrolase [Flavobacteriaceae bacterium]|jgi:PTH1 family peptidyl-tRNA hydrolase
MFSLKRIFSKKTPSLTMKKFLIVGLGNIGDEYENTRHNVGFSILDDIAAKNECLWESKKLASHGVLKNKGRKFILIKPTTFMNRSGKAVKYWALQENIPLENILILTDEIHLPFGTIRIKEKGSPAGHNGLKDIESQLNTPHYARLRFGIGQEPKPFDQVKFVLDTWTATEEKELAKRIEKCGEAILSFGLEGLETAMNRFNGK